MYNLLVIIEATLTLQHGIAARYIARPLIGCAVHGSLVVLEMLHLLEDDIAARYIARPRL